MPLQSLFVELAAAGVALLQLLVHSRLGGGSQQLLLETRLETLVILSETFIFQQDEISFT